MNHSLTPEALVIQRCEHRVGISHRLLGVGGILLAFVLAIIAGRKIVMDRNYHLENTKTTKLFAEAVSLSGTATVMIDAKGVILKSDLSADKMFENGANIEGRNIHDFCDDAKATTEGVKGMENWYRNSKPGSQVLMLVTARLPNGPRDLAITATSVPPNPGSTMAAWALINYADQVILQDLRTPKKTP